MTTLGILLDVLARVGDLILVVINENDNSEEMIDEALARFAELQDKLMAHDDFAEELQDELDAAVPK